MYTTVMPKIVGYHARSKKRSIYFAIEFSLRKILSLCTCTRSFARSDDAKIMCSRVAQSQWNTDESP